MKIKHLKLRCISFLLMLGMAWASHASPEIIVPRLSETPVVDGCIDEATWLSAVKLPVEPQEYCQMHVGFENEKPRKRETEKRSGRIPSRKQDTKHASRITHPLSASNSFKKGLTL